MKRYASRATRVTGRRIRRRRITFMARAWLALNEAARAEDAFAFAIKHVPAWADA
jgi:hypothetical protein